VKFGPSFPVPYVTRWSGEQDGPMPMVVRRDRRGIAYANERRYDRDENGVLWMRTLSEPGKGRPQFGKIHSLRQRLAMGRLLCQVCGGPADWNADGVLWLIDAAPDDPSLGRGPEHTAHPPVCLPCARTSLRLCPHLRRASVAIRVRDVAPAGVSGAVYVPAHPKPVAVDAMDFRDGDPRLAWMLGSQLIMELRDFTVIDLEAEIISAEREPS
jgi:hypothetical protein